MDRVCGSLANPSNQKTAFCHPDMSLSFPIPVMIHRGCPTVQPQQEHRKTRKTSFSRSKELAGERPAQRFSGQSDHTERSANSDKNDWTVAINVPLWSVTDLTFSLNWALNLMTVSLYIYKFHTLTIATHFCFIVCLKRLVLVYVYVQLMTRLKTIKVEGLKGKAKSERLKVTG